MDEPRLPTARSAILAFVELFALAGFAVAQPVLDVFGRSPETFLFHGASTGEIVAFTVVVVLGPPLVAFGIEVGAGLVHPPARAVVHRLLVGGLAGLLVAVLVARVVGVRWLLVLLVLAGAAGAFELHRRVVPARTWLRFGAVGPVAFAVLFLGFSDVSALVGAGDGPTADELERLDVDTPVVLVVFDELPLVTLLDDDLAVDRDLYPNFAALADGSDWYRNATTLQVNTVHAVPSMMTGRIPTSRHSAPVWSEHPDSLFTLLGGSYSIHASEAMTQLCPPGLCVDRPPRGGDGLRGLLDDARAVLGEQVRAGGPRPPDVGQFAERFEGDRGLGAGAPVPDAVAPGPDPGGPGGEEATDRERGIGVDRQPRRLRAFVDAIADLHEPSFGYLHLVLPHTPWEFLPGGARYEQPPLVGIAGFDQWGDDPWPLLLARQRHVLQTMYTDALLGSLLDELRALDRYDDALVVVTADHGVTFRPGTRLRVPVDGNHVEALWVPLFVKRPGQSEPTVSDADVQLHDLPAIVADALGVEIPWEHEGAVPGDRIAGATKPYVRLFELEGGPPGPVEFPADRLAERLRALVYPSARRGDDPRWWPHQVGPRPDLVGRSVATFRRASEPAGTVELEVGGPGSPPAGYVPAAVLGDLDAPVPDLEVAVAWGGQIAAVVPLVGDLTGDARIAAMVPEVLLEAHPEGPLELYALEDEDPAGPVLAPFVVDG